MFDISAALSFLTSKLWNDEIGAFKEAVTIEKYHLNDNTLAWYVMRKYDPSKAHILKEGFLQGHIDPRWCILDGDTVNFTRGSIWLPDYLRYADLVTLEFLYHEFSKEAGKDIHFGVLNGMYELVHENFLYDMATSFEGYTIYKLCLFSICSVFQNHADLARKLLEHCSSFQVEDGEELGGVKTEWVPPEWDDRYPHLLKLANCETTSLAILAQDFYTNMQRRKRDLVIIGAASGSAGIILSQTKSK